MAVAAETRTAIESLVAEFAWRIDHHHGVGVPDLFTPDGTYAMRGGGQLSGREAIESFYRARHGAGDRTSRHVFTNLRLEAQADGRVRGACVLTLHAADGQGPHPTSLVMVADYEDEYVNIDGGWKFERREAGVVFGTTPAVVAQAAKEA